MNGVKRINQPPVSLQSVKQNKLKGGNANAKKKSSQIEAVNQETAQFERKESMEKAQGKVRQRRRERLT